MSAASTDRETEYKANELYWGSELSVNQIAEDLDLSKGVLYGLIRPRPAGLACPECSEEVVHPNRTAKERGALACPSCGWEGDEMDADANGGDGGVSLPSFGDDDDDVSVPSIRLSPSLRRTALGGALLGAAVGLVLVFWARRR